MQEAKPRPITLDASEHKLQAPTKSVKEAAGAPIKAHVPTLKTYITAADTGTSLMPSAASSMLQEGPEASAVSSMLQEGPEAHIRQVHETRAIVTRIPVAHCLVFTHKIRSNMRKCNIRLEKARPDALLPQGGVLLCQCATAGPSWSGRFNSLHCPPLAPDLATAATELQVQGWRASVRRKWAAPVRL